jgi:hypothetical protein
VVFGCCIGEDFTVDSFAVADNFLGFVVAGIVVAGIVEAAVVDIAEVVVGIVVVGIVVVLEEVADSFFR